MELIAASLLACAAFVSPVTLQKIIHAESGGNPLAINVNRHAGPNPVAATPQEASAIARRFISAGYSVDLGMMQINSRNLGSLGYTVEEAFDPCRNITGGATILREFYGSAVARYGAGQPALMAAISAYNTGSFWRGFSNGYVSRVVGIPEIPFPAATASDARPAPRLPDPYTADTVAYSRGGMDVRVE
jgi:type IV secretion system protein VirB1